MKILADFQICICVRLITEILISVRKVHGTCDTIVSLPKYPEKSYAPAVELYQSAPLSR